MTGPDDGRVPLAPGSREPSPTVSALTGFDPSREAWPEIEWDDDGYPVGELDGFPALKDLPMDFWLAAQFLLRELPAAAAHCCAWCEVTDAVDPYDDARPLKHIAFSTGGWSGAESIIGLIESRFDLSHFMLSWRRGGHFVFEIPAHLLTRDRDRSGEADKTGTGLAEGESPGRETASPHTSPPSSPQAG